jgi:hypothetical protein
MNRAEKIFAIGLLAVSIVFFIVSLEYPLMYRRGIGEGFLPRSVTILLIVLSCGYIWKAFFGGKSEDSEPMPPRSIMIRNLGMLLLLIVTVILIKLLGMIAAIGIFLVIAMRYYENLTWKKAALFSVVSMIVCYVLFEQLLGLSLPKGLFF